jgi:hypothetical protein
MVIGAGNKPGDIVNSLGRSKVCVSRQRNNFDNAGVSLNSLNSTRLIAEDAKRNGCGNCGEQAAIAFIFLVDNGVRPVEMFAFTNRDHGFVVIGRPERSTVSNPMDWGGAIICDPWLENGKVYYAHHLRTFWSHRATLAKPMLIQSVR